MHCSMGKPHSMHALPLCCHVQFVPILGPNKWSIYSSSILWVLHACTYAIVVSFSGEDITSSFYMNSNDNIQLTLCTAQSGIIEVASAVVDHVQTSIATVNKSALPAIAQ